MRSLKLKIGIIIIIAILTAIFLQTRNSLFNNILKESKSLASPMKKISTNEIIPLGINNPFSFLNTDTNSESCVKSKNIPQKTPSYSENHIEIKDLKNCLPVAVSYMNNIKDIGINVISQYFIRQYDENGIPYFGSEKRNNEMTIQLYANLFGNYFWAAVNPASSKGFIGDIDIETHKILTENKNGEKTIYLPASEAGFAEWQKWLNASFNYLKDHNALDKLVYIQIGNESDDDYAKANKIERDNRDDFYWSAYAKLIEKSYNIIKSKSPNTKIAIGAMGSGGVTVDGFQRPVLEYLAGKIDENGNIVNKSKRCGGTGCFDVYDYHTFSSYKEYKGRTACQPRDCVNPIIVIEKTPEYMKKLLSENYFGNKKLVIQQGGTYTGQDNKINQMEEYQTEEDQASYLIKRSIYLLATGAEQIQFGTYIEHDCYDGTIHNWFTMMGFAYNGIPQNGTNECGEKNFNGKDCDGQSPCSDPGKNVKKLSYFSYKKLIEFLRDGDWNKIEKIKSPSNDVYVFKMPKNNGKAVYFAWWDWWKSCPRPDFKKVEMDTACINNNKPIISIDVGKNISNVKITELVPNFPFGANVEKTGYTKAFNSYSGKVTKETASIVLGTKPIYIETGKSK